MNRTGLVSIVAAGALLLAACSSNTAGTPSAAGGGASTAAPVVATSGAITGTPLSPPSSSAESSSSDTRAPESSTTGDATDSPVESTDESTESSDKPTTTLSGTDDETIAWFTSFCTGFVGLASADEPKPNSGDPAQYKTAMVSYLQKIGGQLTKTAQELSAIPPPGFEHGTELAAKVIAVFGASGPQITAAAAQLEASSAKTVEEITQVMSTQMGNVGKMFSDLGLENYDFDDATEANLKKIPACSTLFGG